MTVQLVYLPTHILIQIASYLPVSAAIPLSTTCSTLCSVSEISIWEEINLSIHRSTPTSWVTGDSPLGKSKLRQTRLPSDHKIDLHPAAREILESRSLGRYIGFTLDHLAGRGGARLRYVRKIEFDLDRPIPFQLISLLQKTSPTLRHLELITPESVLEFDTPKGSGLTLETAILHFKDPFLRLQYLTLPINSKWEERIRGMLPLAPHLQKLRLVPSMPYSGGWTEASIFPPAVNTTNWPTLPSLRVLEIDQMADSLVPMVLCLIQDAPLLGRVALSDAGMMWSPSRDDELLFHLSVLSLEYLAFTSKCLPALVASRGYRKLRVLSVEAADRITEGGRLDNLPIPPLPTLQRVSIMRCLDTRVIACDEWSSHPGPICPIPPHFRSQLLDAPDLGLVRFPTSSTSEQSGASCMSSRPQADIDDMVLIRTYHPASSDSKEAFIHCRSHTSNYVQPADGLIYHTQGLWEEYTDYLGKCVPAEMLSKVYALSGASARWVKPGRGLTLSDASWAALGDWYTAESDNEEAEQFAELPVRQKSERGIPVVSMDIVEQRLDGRLDPLGEQRM